MPIYVAVLGFQGIVDDVSVHRTMDNAMKDVDGHITPSGLTAEQWFEQLRQTNEYPSDNYEPTNIYVCELED